LSTLRNQLQFGRLIGWHETVQRPGAENFRHLGQTGLDLACVLFGLAHDVDGAGAGIRIFSQIEIGRDRFDLGVSQMDRIEVELEKIERRHPGDGD
jgi:hypothetical protein